MEFLLAVDLGVRTGFAMFNSDGKLLWQRSRNFGNKSRLKSAAHRILLDNNPVDVLVIEGGGDIATIWKKQAEGFNVRVIQTDAEEWRNELFFARQFSGSAIAKKNAITHARKVIEASDLPQPKTLLDDAAEAILTGYWACKHLGWIKL